MRRITAHHYVECGKSIPEDHTIAVDGPIAKSTDSEGESESDNDMILCESDTNSDRESDSGSSDGLEAEDFVNEPPTEKTTRSGRRTGHWSTRYTDYVQY